MTKIRIRLLPAPEGDGLAMRVRDWTDLEVTAIAPDGREIGLTNIQRVTFIAEAGLELPRAIVEFINVEIDATTVDFDGSSFVPPGASVDADRGFT